MSLILLEMKKREGEGEKAFGRSFGWSSTKKTAFVMIGMRAHGSPRPYLALHFPCVGSCDITVAVGIIRKLGANLRKQKPKILQFSTVFIA